EIDELLPEGIGEVEEEKEKLSDLTERLSNEITANYSEGEEELAKINESLHAVDTTTEFFEQEKVRERERRDREKAQDLRERIMLGEEVEKNDRRWLDRYDAKLLAADQAAAEAAAGPAQGADSNEADMVKAEDGSEFRG
ncbi:MAG: SMC-Scp complex subunit ScpB, partial [Bdellovibrionota bacterium]